MAIRALPHRRPWLLDRPLRGAVRGVAFTGKELHEIFRQPRLLLGLVVGMNLFGTVYCCNAVAPVMKSQRSGKIINVSSQAGLRGNLLGENAHYCVAKAGINEYTRLLAGEVGQFNINVNAIAPGMILTSRANKQFNRSSPESVAKYTAVIALRQYQRPAAS